MEKELEEIIMKQLVSETLSENEKACFEEWYKNPSHQEYFRKLLKIRSGVMAYSVKDKVNRERAWNKVCPLRKISWVRQVLKYAAILLLPLCVGLFLLTWEQEKVQTVYVEPVIKPGGKLAVLTLSTGKQVELAGNVSAMSEQGAEISNSTDKELVYKQVGDMAPVEEVYNTITIPRGGEYKLVLADGTIVWLNSDSYIRFPVAFSGDKRQVELRGEAYFEVAKNPEKKFIVSTSHQSQIEVLGTHFNVEAYEKEDRIAATLVEGKIGFIYSSDNGSKKVLMDPGQKLVYDIRDSKVQLYATSGESEIAWKEGKIIFRNTPLEEGLRMLEKRYNVEFIIKNDRLKGEYVVNNSFRSFKSYDQYLNAMEKFGKYLVTPSLKMRAEAVGTKLYDTKAGGQAADFTYPDVDGKMVSLSDFKGKVVLVDVWATWCGPCRQQIPYLKKLEEEMHGTDVVFGGVSVDESKDKQKWLDFIKTEGLKGVQLLAGGWSKITKDYKITGIPRFMVFDKKGNIVSVDAPRPSSPELKKMLENEESRLKQIT